MPGQGGRGIARRARAFACACALWLAAPGLSAGPPDPQARAIFDALHVSLELEDIAAQAASSVAEPARLLPRADAILLRAAVAACFEPERLSALALDTFSARLDRSYAPAALGWLERPETQVLLSRALAGDAELEAPADAEAEARDRDALLQRFEQRSGRAGRAQRRAALVFAAMLRAANPLLPPLQRYSASELDLLVISLHDRFGDPHADPSALRRRYAGIPSRDLESALAFLESPAGNWLRRELDASLERALVRAARAAAAQLVGSLGSGAPATPLQVARLQEP